MKRQILISLIILGSVLTMSAQNSPFYIYGTGLDGSLYQKSALYSDINNGLLIEAPVKSDGSALPFQLSWRGEANSKFSFGRTGIFYIHGAGLDGSLLQKTSISTDGTNGLLIEGPRNSSNVKLPIKISWRGDENPFITIQNDLFDVKGAVRAHEVKVCLTQGCDFVFKTDYKLMDLKELEHFVKTNQHLPEIAPEKEMVENGVNMKELQMKLLQKIEELTLYTIEQNKRMEEQNEKIVALEKQNEAIVELKQVIRLQSEKIEKIENASK